MNKQKIYYTVKGAKEIMDTIYEPFDFVVENLIPSHGLILFAGAPKVGKSWFVLQLLLGICYQKSDFIGHKISITCPCLYLSLEDSEERIQDRIKKQGGNPNEDRLLFAFEWRSNDKGVEDIRDFLSKNTDVKVVCIDTKGSFSEGRENESFQSDYTWMRLLKKIAKDLNVAIILVTHFRKKRADEDPFEKVSGSSANMAAADTTIMLTKVRNQNKGTISCTSRDFQERDEDIYFDPITCTWTVPSGNNVIVENLTPERQKIIEAMEEINKECTPLQIANIVGGTSKNISNMLSTMKKYGFVESGSERGHWMLPQMNDNNYEIE